MTTQVQEGTTEQHGCLDEFFSASVIQYPSRAALVIGGERRTYSELDYESRAIERTLRSAGLTGGKQRNIGLVYARTPFSYAAVIAIMRSGNVYVPLNIKAPAERLLKVVADAEIHAVIVDARDGLPEAVQEMLQRGPPLDVITADAALQPSLETCMSGSGARKRWRVSKAVTASDWSDYSRDDSTGRAASLAYIIYTSGSTGVPKGVAIRHDSARRCIEKVHRLFDTGCEDRFTQFSALSFDMSLVELFWCWKSGGTSYVPLESEALVPFSYAVSNGITVWSSVPSLATFLLKLGLLKDRALPCIRWTLFGGDAFPAELARVWAAAAPRSRTYNLYGPTEVTVISTYYECTSQSPTSGLIPIGIPLPGLQCMIVDEGQVIESEEVPGELWIAGDQLAVGYWNNGAATRASFVRFPQADPDAQLWYRTGDVVSWSRGRVLSFRHRLDRQVKLRGYRIELQEIESALRKVLGCALVAAVPVRSPTGVCERIVAYCDELKETEATIRSRCCDQLPRYMVPERIYALDPFPLSDNGKIDYLALTARTKSL